MASHLQINADEDTDPAYHCDADPDSADHFDADPDPTFQFDANTRRSGSATLLAFQAIISTGLVVLSLIISRHKTPGLFHNLNKNQNR